MVPLLTPLTAQDTAPMVLCPVERPTGELLLTTCLCREHAPEARAHGLTKTPSLSSVRFTLAKRVADLFLTFPHWMWLYITRLFWQDLAHSPSPDTIPSLGGEACMALAPSLGSRLFHWPVSMLAHQVSTRVQAALSSCQVPYS